MLEPEPTKDGKQTRVIGEVLMNPDPRWREETVFEGMDRLSSWGRSNRMEREKLLALVLRDDFNAAFTEDKLLCRPVGSAVFSEQMELERRLKSTDDKPAIEHMEEREEIRYKMRVCNGILGFDGGETKGVNPDTFKIEDGDIEAAREMLKHRIDRLDREQIGVELKELGLQRLVVSRCLEQLDGKDIKIVPKKEVDGALMHFIEEQRSRIGRRVSEIQRARSGFGTDQSGVLSTELVCLFGASDFLQKCILTDEPLDDVSISLLHNYVHFESERISAEQERLERQQLLINKRDELVGDRGVMIRLGFLSRYDEGLAANSAILVNGTVVDLLQAVEVEGSVPDLSRYFFALDDDGKKKYIRDLAKQSPSLNTTWDYVENSFSYGKGVLKTMNTLALWKCRSEADGQSLNEWAAISIDDVTDRDETRDGRRKAAKWEGMVEPLVCIAREYLSEFGNVADGLLNGLDDETREVIIKSCFGCDAFRIQDGVIKSSFRSSDPYGITEVKGNTELSYQREEPYYRRSRMNSVVETRGRSALLFYKQRLMNGARRIVNAGDTGWDQNLCLVHELASMVAAYIFEQDLEQEARLREKKKE